MKTLLTLQKSILIHLNSDEKKKFFEAINLHFLGDEVCNHMVDGKMVSKYPEKETNEFIDLNYKIHRDQMLNIQIELKENGKFVFSLPEKRISKK